MLHLIRQSSGDATRWQRIIRCITTYKPIFHVNTIQTPGFDLSCSFPSSSVATITPLRKHETPSQRFFSTSTNIATEDSLEALISANLNNDDDQPPSSQPPNSQDMTQLINQHEQRLKTLDKRRKRVPLMKGEVGAYSEHQIPVFNLCYIKQTNDDVHGASILGIPFTCRLLMDGSKTTKRT